MATKNQRQSTPLKDCKPKKASAQVVPYDGRWVCSLQYPGSWAIFSKNFDTEKEANQHAVEFLLQFKQSDNDWSEKTVKARRFEVG